MVRCQYSKGARELSKPLTCRVKQQRAKTAKVAKVSLFIVADWTDLTVLSSSTALGIYTIFVVSGSGQLLT